MIIFYPCHGLKVIMQHLPLIEVYICYARMKTRVISEEGILSTLAPTSRPFTSFSIMLDPLLSSK